MSQSHRIAQGGVIDRGAPRRFTFDGKSYEGLAGDTLASALVANGVKLFGRSFKYHRPRGLLAAGSEEPNALVELREGARREPNTRATTVELYDGLVAASQNRWPSLEFDAMAVTGLASPFFVAGFYYKTFMWPAAFWEKVYEPIIRRAAGLGRAAEAPDPDHYEKATAHCDVLVIGAEPEGLLAALAAGRAGARVILAEEDFALGGRALAERWTFDGRAGPAWVEGVRAELSAMPEVRIMPRTGVFGVYDHGVYGALEKVADHLPQPGAHQPRQRLWRIVAKRAVLAAGAIERPLVFGDNDRPGVMLAGAARAYANRFAAAPGRQVVIAGGSDDLAATALDLAAAGVEIAAVVDARADSSPAVKAAAQEALLAGGKLLRALGGLETDGALVADAEGRERRIPCDFIAVSGGWSPAIQLATHLGAKPIWSERIAAFGPPERPPAGMAIVGAAAGVFELTAGLRQGVDAGAAAAEACGFAPLAVEIPQTRAALAQGLAPTPAQTKTGKAFIDFQNDVTAKDVEIAEREGFRAVEHLKRYTTLGMATDQGKTANLNGLALMADLTGRSVPETGTTRARPPFHPVAIGAFAGHHRGKDFRPIRYTPSHAWAAERGAVFVEVGPWLRAQWYPLPGETDWLESVSREVTAVRTGVGVCDVSTLGKIDVQGTDAGAFLDRVYTNTVSTLAVGRIRYGVMLREDGMVMDDGTAARLATDRYFMTTTTANAAKVLQHLEFCAQWLWPGLDVQFASATDQWAQFSVAGPRSRDLLGRIVDPAHDISDAAFPFMAAGEISVCGGLKARLFRVSFSGEQAYEIAVPARYGDALIRRMFEVGGDLGLTPYGTEALGVMRIEKGHPAGNELNGTTTARDLGLGKLVSAKKDCIGRVMAGREGLVDPKRPTLAGFRPVNKAERLRAGAHFLAVGAEAKAEHDQGYMTSVAYSPTLGCWIGLGLIERGPERHGEIVRAYDPVRGGDVEVEIVNPVFVDPAGERVRG